MLGGVGGGEAGVSGFEFVDGVIDFHGDHLELFFQFLSSFVDV